MKTKIEIAPAEGELFEHAPTALVLRGKPTYEEWCEEGMRLYSRDNAGRWQFGDWVEMGERLFVDQHTQADALTLYAPRTIANKAWVCNRFEPSRRRELPYTFSHHDAVASLEPSTQEVLLNWCKILDDEGKWTGRIRGRDELREAVRLYKHNQKRLAAGENLDDPEPEPPAPPAPIAVMETNAWVFKDVPELAPKLLGIGDYEPIRIEIWKGTKRA